MCCQSGLFVLCQLCFYCPWKAAASAAQSRSPCSGRNNGTSVFLEKEGGGGSEVGTGWGDAGFMLGGTEGVFPAARPLCASCQAVMLYRPTRGAVRRWGGGRGPCSRCSHTVTLRWVCPSSLVKQKTVFLSFPPHTPSPPQEVAASSSSIMFPASCIINTRVDFR